MATLSATPISGADPGALFALGIFIALLVVGGVWADRIEKRWPK
jgi:hypothetical protein